MQDPTLKWWHVRWRLAWHLISPVARIAAKTLLVLLLIAAAGCCSLYLLQPWLECKSLAHTDPRLYLVPIDLRTKERASLSKPCFNHFGLTCLLPNGAGDSKAPAVSGMFVRLHDGYLFISNPLRDDWVVPIVVHDDKHLSLLLDEKTLLSNFALLETALSTTPDQANWWRFRSKKNQEVGSLLAVKFTALTQGFSSHIFTNGPLFSIDTGNVHGFQVGDPGAAPFETHLDLFDGEDRHISLDLSGPEGHGKLLTQEEINAMVSSIRFTSNQ